MRLLLAIAICVAACGGGGQRTCAPMPCATPCGAVGYRTDANGCRISCECNGAPQACPAIDCGGSSCGLDNAKDPTTGCPTCTCCSPADCQPGGCHATGNDGCPTCVAC